MSLWVRNFGKFSDHRVAACFPWSSSLTIPAGKGTIGRSVEQHRSRPHHHDVGGLAKTLLTTAELRCEHRPLDVPLRSLIVAAALAVDTALKQDARRLNATDPTDSRTSSTD